MNTKGDHETYPDEVIKEMNSRFSKIYDGKAFEIYNMNFEHEVCPDCEGSGVVVDADGISSCKKCQGSGIRKIPIRNRFIKAYMVYDSEPGSFEIDNVLGIYKTRDDAETYYSFMSAGNKDFEKHIAETFISKHLDFDEMWTTLHRLFTSARGCEITVIDTYFKKIIYSGISWTQFWHNGYSEYLVDDIKEYQDLDAMTNGRYIMLPTLKFEKEYEFHDNKFMNELYTSQFSNVVYNYLPYVTYGEEAAYKLITRYMEIYPFIESIRENLVHHVMQGFADSENFIVGDTDMPKLHKLIHDFELIGMHVDMFEGGAIVKKIQSLVPAINPLIDKFSMVAVFLFEYVLISAEYANLTEDE